MAETLSPVLLGRLLPNLKEERFLSTKANAETYYNPNSGSQVASHALYRSNRHTMAKSYLGMTRAMTLCVPSTTEALHALRQG